MKRLQKRTNTKGLLQVPASSSPTRENHKDWNCNSPNFLVSSAIISSSKNAKPDGLTISHTRHIRKQCTAGIL